MALKVKAVEKLVKFDKNAAGTAIQITCIDRNGNEVKRVTSTDDGEVEGSENEGD